MVHGALCIMCMVLEAWCMVHDVSRIVNLLYLNILDPVGLVDLAQQLRVGDGDHLHQGVGGGGGYGGAYGGRAATRKFGFTPSFAKFYRFLDI